jgi:hypothetical protein
MIPFAAAKRLCPADSRLLEQATLVADSLIGDARVSQLFAPFRKESQNDSGSIRFFEIIARINEIN